MKYTKAVFVSLLLAIFGCASNKGDTQPPETGDSLITLVGFHRLLDGSSNVAYEQPAHDPTEDSSSAAFFAISVLTNKVPSSHGIRGDYAKLVLSIVSIMGPKGPVQLSCKRKGDQAVELSTEPLTAGRHVLSVAKHHVGKDNVSIKVAAGEASLAVPDPHEIIFYSESRPSVLGVRFEETTPPMMYVRFSENIKLDTSKAALAVTDLAASKAVPVADAAVSGKFLSVSLPDDFSMTSRLTLSVGDAVVGRSSGIAVVQNPFGPGTTSNLLEIVPSEHIGVDKEWRADRDM